MIASSIDLILSSFLWFNAGTMTIVRAFAILTAIVNRIILRKRL